MNLCRETSFTISHQRWRYLIRRCRRATFILIVIVQGVWCNISTVGKRLEGVSYCSRVHELKNHSLYIIKENSIYVAIPDMWYIIHKREKQLPYTEHATVVEKEISKSPKNAKSLRFIYLFFWKKRNNVIISLRSVEKKAPEKLRTEKGVNCMRSRNIL